MGTFRVLQNISIWHHTLIIFDIMNAQTIWLNCFKTVLHIQILFVSVQKDKDTDTCLHVVKEAYIEHIGTSIALYFLDVANFA